MFSKKRLALSDKYPPVCREASELRQLLDEGVAPKPPKFWSAKPGHPDVGDEEEEEEALTEELLLCWRPEPGSPVRERVVRKIGQIVDFHMCE